MGDFEDVFGVGADCEAIIDGFSRSAMREAEEEAEEQRRFNASIWLDAKIEASGYSLYLEDYEAVRYFDKVAQFFGIFSFAFTRRREGTGYRVIVDRKSHQEQTYFSRPGRIVVIASQDDAADYAAQSGAHVFEMFQTNQMPHQKVELDPLIFEHLDGGRDVVVLGWGLERTILNARAPFVGWSKAGGFAPITDKSMLATYYCHSYKYKSAAKALEEQDQPYAAHAAPVFQKTPSSSIMLTASQAPVVKTPKNNGLEKIERERLSLPLSRGAAHEFCRADDQPWKEAAAKRAARKLRKSPSKPKAL